MNNRNYAIKSWYIEFLDNYILIKVQGSLGILILLF